MEQVSNHPILAEHRQQEALGVWLMWSCCANASMFGNETKECAARYAVDNRKTGAYIDKLGQLEAAAFMQ